MLGLDLLGLADNDWKIQPTIDVFPQGWALGVFAREFGNALPKVKQLLQSGKVAALRVQMHWDKDHSIRPTIAPLDFLKRELPRWEALHAEFPNIPFYISHTCEYSEKRRSEIQKRIDLVLALCPSCVVVQCPMGGSPTIPGYLLESHGEHARGGIVSTDGMNIYDLDAEAWVQKAIGSAITFLWGARFNLRESGPFIPTDKRTAAPSQEYLLGVIRLGSPMGIAPAPTFKDIPLKKPGLYKSFAEDGPGEHDKRDNRPVVMLKQKTNAVDLVTFNNQRVLRLPLYPDSRPHEVERYYSGKLSARQIALKAQMLSGSEYVWIRQGDKYYGPINGAFRAGFFQTEK